jgi:hypothetical protein
MTTLNWNHVDHQITREVLAHPSPSEEDIRQALNFANECLQADQHNEDVSGKVYYARGAALTEADARWHIQGDAPGTIEALKKFWSV